MHIDDMGGFEEVLVGAMTIQTYTTPVPQFQTYFESLTPGNTRNPWFPLLYVAYTEHGHHRSAGMWEG